MASQAVLRRIVMIEVKRKFGVQSPWLHKRSLSARHIPDVHYNQTCAIVCPLRYPVYGSCVTGHCPRSQHATNSSSR